MQTQRTTNFTSKGMILWCFFLDKPQAVCILKRTCSSILYSVCASSLREEGSTYTISRIFMRNRKGRKTLFCFRLQVCSSFTNKPFIKSCMRLPRAWPCLFFQQRSQKHLNFFRTNILIKPKYKLYISLPKSDAKSS